MWLLWKGFVKLLFLDAEGGAEEEAPVVTDRATAEGDEIQEPLAASGGDAEAVQPEGTKDIQPAATEPAKDISEPNKAPQPAEAGQFLL